MSMYSYCMFIYVYTDWGFSVLFPQLQGKRQGKTRQDGARPELFLILVLLYVFCVLLYVFLCCSMYFLCCSMYVCVALCIFVLFYVCFVVLCIVCFVSFSVLFVCICVLYYCHRMATQLQLNISYQIHYENFHYDPPNHLQLHCRKRRNLHFHEMLGAI